jgi:DNA-binding winged helix-turn-helix (wHTH) protein/Tfp pilus assembly protein PilF
MNDYEFGPFQIDVERLMLAHAGSPVALGPKVVETLLALVEQPRQVLTKSMLLDRIWPDGFVEEGNLSQNVHVLRRTFRQYGFADPIETVPRRGYRFTAPVHRVASAPIPLLHAEQAHSRRVLAAIAGAAFVAVSLALVASNGIGHRGAAPPALSSNGAALYQIGHYYWNLRTRDGVGKSLDYFAQVVDADPHNALGYAALADANAAMGDYCYGTHKPDVYFARAQAYAQHALALDPDSAQAHAALGFIALHRNDMPVAMRELSRALDLDPSDGTAQEWYGIALLTRGRTAEGVAHLKTAADLDPLSVATIAWLGSAAYLDRRFNEAITYSNEALELSPRRLDVMITIGQSYESQGDLSRAIAAFNRYGAVAPYYRPEAAALLAHAYALEHQTSLARAQLAYARAHANAVDPSDLDAAAAALGERLGDNRKQREGHAHLGVTYG